jgi:hypothetical protein
MFADISGFYSLSTRRTCVTKAPADPTVTIDRFTYYNLLLPLSVNVSQVFLTAETVSVHSTPSQSLG